MLEALTFIIVVLGVLTVSLSIFVTLAFWLHERKLDGDARMLTKALKRQLFAEAMLGLGTCVFAIAAHTEVLPDWPVWLQSLIRLFILGTAALTTWHLWRVIEKLHGQH